MAKCSIITPAEADFIESRAHAMLDVIEDLPEDVKTGPVTVYDYEFQSPSDAIWQLYLKRDFAGMRIVIDDIRKQATHSNNRPDDIWISSCCRVLSRYLGDIERIVLKPIAIRLHETINAVKTDSLLTLQLHRASINVDSQNPANAVDLIEDILKWTDPTNNPDTALPKPLRARLAACVETLRGFPGSGHKNPDIRGADKT